MLCTGGKFVFVRVCTFRRNFCVEKKWRGLRYGNFYVGGTNLGTFVCCVNVIIIYGKCLFACDLIGAFVWCKLLVVIRVHGICLNEMCFVSGQVVGGGTCVFFGRGMCVWKQVCRDVEIFNLVLCFSL